MFRRSLLAVAAAAVLGGCARAGGEIPASSPSPGPGTREPEPGRSAPREPFRAGTRELELNRGGDRPLPTKLWLPAADGPAPLIYFSHGLTSQPDDYADLLAAWSAAGFVVAAPKYPHTWNGAPDFDQNDVVNQPADAQFVISEVVGALPGQVDPARIAAAGHSAGGITTVGLFSGSRDGRLRAGLIISGRQMPQPMPFSGAPAPLLFVQGKLDKTVTYEQAYGAYNEVRWPKAFLELPRGTHLPHRDEPAVVAAVTTDFWRWALTGDEAAKARMSRETGVAALTGTL